MLTLTDQAIDQLNDVLKGYPESYAPHCPPIPFEEYEELGPAYSASIPYRWTGDLLHVSGVLAGRQERRKEPAGHYPAFTSGARRCDFVH